MRIISIIDDDDSLRFAISRLVRSLGFDARAFASARAFLDSGHLDQTACLISDIQMPEMSGLALQDALQARGHDLPIIFITAFPDETIRARAMVGGAVGFLGKPFKEETLLRCLDVALKNDARKGG